MNISAVHIATGVGAVVSALVVVLGLIFDWETWQSMSAVKGEAVDSSVPATPSDAPTSDAPAPR